MSYTLKLHLHYLRCQDQLHDDDDNDYDGDDSDDDHNHDDNDSNDDVLWYNIDTLALSSMSGSAPFRIRYSAISHCSSLQALNKASSPTYQNA